MIENSFTACVKIAACICGRDGIISQAEETTLRDLSTAKFPSFDDGEFESAIQSIFDEEVELEDLLAMVTDQELRRTVLTVAEKSANADGLDHMENVALVKSYELWRISRDA